MYNFIYIYIYIHTIYIPIYHDMVTETVARVLSRYRPGVPPGQFVRYCYGRPLRPEDAAPAAPGALILFHLLLLSLLQVLWF